MEETPHMSSWFSQPVYARYWRHYEQAVSWYQRHRRAYQKALEAAYGMGYPPYPCPPSRYADWHDEEGRDRSPAREKEEEEEEEESSSDSEIECDVSNMEITEELRQYFAQTERHREELRRQQETEAENHLNYVPADQDLYRASQRSAAAPSDRPGERRTVEMRRLYGEAAARIQGMETALQLGFDRNCDRKQPRYWPVIPLKL